MKETFRVLITYRNLDLWNGKKLQTMISAESKEEAALQCIVDDYESVLGRVDVSKYKTPDGKYCAVEKLLQERGIGYRILENCPNSRLKAKVWYGKNALVIFEVFED